MTEAMRAQMRDAKERHPGMLLAYRLGDFWEFFGADAEAAAKCLGLTLTSRDKEPMCWFPNHAIETHLPQLLRSGHRVALCDLTKDESKIVTPPDCPMVYRCGLCGCAFSNSETSGECFARCRSKEEAREAKRLKRAAQRERLLELRQKPLEQADLAGPAWTHATEDYFQAGADGKEQGQLF